MKANYRILVSAAALIFLTGMGMQGAAERMELKPEIRLKLYDEAIRHYEKAKAYHEAGRPEEALKKLRKATRVISAFPEAYGLARTIYLGLGKQREAEEQDALYKQHGGDKGSSLYRLRERVAEEIVVRKKLAPPPDIRAVPALALSGVAVGILLLGVFFERRRAQRDAEGHRRSHAVFLERFPSEEGTEVSVSWLFKLSVLLLPAPIISSLLILLGLRHYSELVPILLFTWIAVDLAIWLVFFADFSDLGGFRRSAGPPG